MLAAVVMVFLSICFANFDGFVGLNIKFEQDIIYGKHTINAQRIFAWQLLAWCQPSTRL